MAHKFIGVWKLMACEMRFPNGRVFYPFGTKPAGYIIYTEDGYMSASLMNTERPMVGMTIEKLNLTKYGFFKPIFLNAAYRYFKAATAYVSYSGPYEIKGDQVIHHCEVSLFPEWTGTTLSRDYEFAGDKLYLRAPVPNGGLYEFVWERTAKK